MFQTVQGKYGTVSKFKQLFSLLQMFYFRYKNPSLLTSSSITRTLVVTNIKPGCTLLLMTLPLMIFSFHREDLPFPSLPFPSHTDTQHDPALRDILLVRRSAAFPHHSKANYGASSRLSQSILL